METQKNIRASEQKTWFIMIGNPGVGKSTILNGFLQAPKFKSGVSIGKGITSVLDRQTDEHGNVLIDTPGLSDIKMRKQASEEIVKALKFGGLYKIFFVLTLEEGRIRPDDKTTMSLVLGAAPEIQRSYSIIINKVSAVVSGLLNDPDQFGEFLALLNESLPGTHSVFANEEDDSLKSKTNAIPKLTPKLLEFLKNAPAVYLMSKNIQPIVTEDTFKELKEFMTAQLHKLKSQSLSKEAQNKLFEEIQRKWEKELSQLWPSEQKQDLNNIFSEIQRVHKDNMLLLSKLESSRILRQKVANSMLLVVGADENRPSWDCWKAVVQDTSTEPSPGIPLIELIKHENVVGLFVSELGLFIHNKFEETFQLFLVEVHPQGLAFHAVKQLQKIASDLNDNILQDSINEFQGFDPI